MRILVTGSSGFIGTSLVKELRKRGHKVVGVDRVPPDGIEPDRFVHGDLLDRKVVEKATSEVRCVFHLAAAKDDWGISRDEYHRDNVSATRQLVRIGRRRGVSKWFYFSTVGVLASSFEPSRETARLEPATWYGESKAQAERIMRTLKDEEASYEITVLRPSAVFGPGQPSTTNVYRLIEAIRNDRFLMVGDGETLKSTSYIENLMAATLFLFNRMTRGFQVFHYVDEPVMSTNYLVGRIHEELCKKPPSWRIPLSVASTLASVSDVAANVLGIDFPITSARIEKFCRPTNIGSTKIRTTGFKQPVSNTTAIERTVQWHLEELVGDH